MKLNLAVRPAADNDKVEIKLTVILSNIQDAASLIDFIKQTAETVWPDQEITFPKSGHRVEAVETIEAPAPLSKKVA